MNKVQKIREKVERLKSQLLRGACSSQIAMETRCKEEAYNEVLAILDTMQEEPVSEFPNIESMIESYKQRLISQANGVKNSLFIDMCLTSYKHGINETLDTLNLSNAQRTVKIWKEPVSEDEIEKQFKVGDIVVYMSRHSAYSGLYLLGNPNDLSIGYSNANEPYQIALRNCTVASEDERRQFMRELNDNGYKWNENILRIDKEEEPASEELEEASRNYADNEEYGDDVYYSIKAAFKAGAKWKAEQFEKNRLKHCNSITNEQAELEQGFIDQHLDKYNRMPTFLDAIEHGMKLQKEQMMAKAIDASCFGFQSAALFSFRLPADKYLVGSEVKIIVIKED